LKEPFEALSQSVEKAPIQNESGQYFRSKSKSSQKQSKKQRFHSLFASFFKFMHANLNLTHFVT
jgi:hypothetical protein